MKVLLVNPRNEKDKERGEIVPALPPLNLFYLRSFLRIHGIEVSVWDENLKGLVDPRGFDLIGVGLYSKEGLGSLERFGDGPVVFGGPAASLIKPGGNRAVVIGSGYWPLLQLIEDFKPGWVYQGGKGQLDLPTLPVEEGYSGACILTQFGCPFRCRFCMAWQLTEYRKRNPYNVLLELRLLRGKVGYFEFFDNDFFLNPLWRIFAREARDFRWGCVTSVRQLRKRVQACNEAADYGLQAVGFGVESLKQETLDAVNKQSCAEEAGRLLEVDFDGRLKPYCFLMFGLPFQSFDDFRRDVDLIAPYFPIKASRLQLTPGTPLLDDFEFDLREDYKVKRTPWMDESELDRAEEIADALRVQACQELYGEVL